MFRIFALVVCVAALADAGIHRNGGRSVGPDQQQAAGHVAVVALSAHGGDLGGYDGGDYDGHGAGAQIPDDGKDASGAELTSLAHSSAVQAGNAVRSQHTAGSQAAFGIKSTLASAAIGAAQTAQAALVGKQAIVQGLKTQVNQAQRQLQGELSQLEKTQETAQATAEAAQQAQSLAQTLTAASAGAQGGASAAGRAAGEAANAAAAQHAMVAEAKRNLAHLLQELDAALGDLQSTELSALKAAEAAQQAQTNAAAAGAAVVAAGAKGAAQQAAEYHHHHH